MVKSQQPQQILTTFKQKTPEKLATKKTQNIQHIKHQREGRNIEQKHKKNITGKTPSTKPTLIETKHYYNNLKHLYIYI